MNAMVGDRKPIVLPRNSTIFPSARGCLDASPWKVADRFEDFLNVRHNSQSSSFPKMILEVVLLSAAVRYNSQEVWDLFR